MPVNPERGEVEFSIGGEKGVICAEMARLAALSHEIGTKSLRDLVERIQGVEPFTMFAAVDCLLVKGDAKAIKAGLDSPQALSAVSAAAIKSLAAFTEGSAKNG